MAEAAKKRNVQAGIEPSVRVFTNWTPALIRSAEAQADSGNLRSAANLCDWLLGDDRVQSTLRNRSQSLLGLDPTFEKSGDKRRSNRVVKALDAQEDWWESYPETELARMLIWGILLGVQPLCHNPKYDEDKKRLLPCIENRHAQHLRWDGVTRKWMIKVATSGMGATTEVELVPGDGTWLLHTPFGGSRPWMYGSWRALAPLVLLKYYARTDWARASGNGSLLVATQDAEATKNGDIAESTKEERRQLAQDIYNRGTDAAIVLPAGFDLKLVEALANAKNTYDAQIEMANAAIAINIRGGNLTTEVKGGSFAATQQHGENDQVNLEFDATSLTTTIQPQSLTWWAEWNYGDRNLAPWPVYPVDPEEDLHEKAETADKAADVVKKFEDQGFVVKRKEFAEEFGLTDWLEPGERPKPPTVAVPVPADLNKPGDPAPSPNPAPDAEPKAKPTGVARLLRLASGMAAAKAQGFIDGQLYTDTLTELATKAGIAELDKTIDAIREELDAATDYDDLRDRLRKRYEELDAENLSDLVEAAMVMANFAGRTAVNQDA